MEISFRLLDIALFLSGDTPEFGEYDGLIRVFGNAALGSMVAYLDDHSSVDRALDASFLTVDLREAASPLIHLKFGRDGIPERDREEGRRFVAGPSIGFLLYAHRVPLSRSTQDDPGLYPCGGATLWIADVVSSSRTTKIVDMRLDFVDPHSSTPCLKGRATCRVERLTLANSTPRLASAKDRNGWLEHQDELADRYISNMMAKFVDGRWKPSRPDLKTVHCPFYRTELPGPGYSFPGFVYAALLPRGRPDFVYYETLIGYALALYEVTDDELRRTVDQSLLWSRSTPDRNSATVLEENRLHRVCNAVAGACAMYAQGQEYVPDHVNWRSVGRVGHKKIEGERDDDANVDVEYLENMNTARTLHACDCEDLGQDALMVARILRSTPWPKESRAACASQVLAWYFPLLVHGAVSSPDAASAGSLPSGRGRQKAIAHIFCLLVPIGRLCTMLRRTGSDPARLGITPDIANMLAWTDRLEHLVCEGTGRTNPILRPPWEWGICTRPLFEQRHQSRPLFETENPAFSSLEFMQWSTCAHPEDPYAFTGFYQALVGAYVPLPTSFLSPFSTTEDLEALPLDVGDLTFVYVPDDSSPSTVLSSLDSFDGSLRYGVSAHDLVYDRSNVGLAYNTFISRELGESIADGLDRSPPIPLMRPRQPENIARDERFLTTSLGLKRWKIARGSSGSNASGDYGAFGSFDRLDYLADMRWMREHAADIRRFTASGGIARFKYFGLSEDTAYVQLVMESGPRTVLVSGSTSDSRRSSRFATPIQPRTTSIPQQDLRRGSGD